MRSEKDVLDDLSALCRSQGYVHAIAYLCFRDNVVRYAGEMSSKDLLQFFSPQRLIRTELSTLIGLMIQEELDSTLPEPSVLGHYISRTEALLEELHEVLLQPLHASLRNKDADQEASSLSRGDLLRETIFYSGESAYSFQYREFALKKYADDDNWLRANKGFSIQTARDVVHSLQRLQAWKLMDTIRVMRDLVPVQRSILPGFTFSITELAEASHIDESSVEAVLNAFTLPINARNENFHALNDFNVANATPILKLDGEFVSFQTYSLLESLYESPFYWMSADNQYAPEAMRNRGRFTEELCRERLELVFGKERVYPNVDIVDPNGTKMGEIDVLVLFGDRAIVVQAKSKRLTLEARKGNDGQLRDDFKKSVQDSYNQGLLCSRMVAEARLTFISSNSDVVVVPTALKEIYIFCVVSDHYPALNFQARQFLKYESHNSIQPPLVLDVFTLDAMTEMLQTPLRFLSYVNQRVNYSERLFASHELVILSYHLRHNLWLTNEADMVCLEDDISADLDVAMAVRRDGVKGKDTPDGVLTRLSTTVLGRVVRDIEAYPDPRTIDLGFFLLTLSEKAIRDISQKISRLAQLGRRDHKNHDITVMFDSNISTGLTVHCNDEPIVSAAERLGAHCELRKYAQKANTWFGMCISPMNESLRFGMNLAFEWQPNHEMDLATRELERPGSMPASARAGTMPRRQKVGRNDPCPCGSGLKYKRCCLASRTRTPPSTG